VKYRLPYADAKDMTPAQLRRARRDGWPLEHSHTLEDQIGGQCAAGLVITDFYEDRYAPGDEALPSQYMPAFFATRAFKP
jgi:hypothetical protein